MPQMSLKIMGWENRYVHASTVEPLTHWHQPPVSWASHLLVFLSLGDAYTNLNNQLVNETFYAPQNNNENPKLVVCNGL